MSALKRYSVICQYGTDTTPELVEMEDPFGIYIRFAEYEKSLLPVHTHRYRPDDVNSRYVCECGDTVVSLGGSCG